MLQELCRREIPFALGGGLALGYYTGQLRESKDLDVYVSPERRQQAVDIVNRCGLTDYYEILAYDRNWIYRAHTGEVIVDTIWAMANRRTVVDDRWTQAGPCVRFCGEDIRILPVEELIWSKLYVLQRDRCDWPDLLNLMYSTGPELDWQHLVNRVAEDLPLLKGLLSVFSWLSPPRARAIPAHVWKTLDLAIPAVEGDPEGRPARKDLLDTRPWLVAETRSHAA